LGDIHHIQANTTVVLHVDTDIISPVLLCQFMFCLSGHLKNKNIKESVTVVVINHDNTRIREISVDTDSYTKYGDLSQDSEYIVTNFSYTVWRDSRESLKKDEIKTVFVYKQQDIRIEHRLRCSYDTEKNWYIDLSKNAFLLFYYNPVLLKCQISWLLYNPSNMCVTKT
jgi:hypothetical protein